MPAHYCIARGDGALVDDNEAAEFDGFAAAIDAVEHTHDFVVIDTPGNDTYLMRLAHSMADTLVTPLNDSFVDFDVLGTVDPATFAVTGTSHLRRHGARGAAPAPHGRPRDRSTGSWCATACRMLGSRNKRLVGEGLQRARRCGSASAPSTALPSAWSFASSIRAG